MDSFGSIASTTGLASGIAALSKMRTMFLFVPSRMSSLSYGRTVTGRVPPVGHSGVQTLDHTSVAPALEGGYL
jgi:hypothetical protein